MLPNLSLVDDRTLEEQCQAKVYELSFLRFGQDFFELVENVPYVHGRHIEVLARHMEAVARKDDPVGRISRLLVNLPPSTSKSIWINVLFPAWVWSWWPQAQFLCFANSDSLVKRDHDKCWKLVNSPEYQRYFPLVRIERGKDQATYFGLTLGGDRRCATPGAALNTGHHPNFILVEDPMTVGNARIFSNRQEQSRWYFNDLSTRGVAKDCAHVVSQQRIHVDDLSGAIKEQDRKLKLGGEDSPWVFLEMAMHFAPERKMVDRGYGGDWRTERGELLFPELLTPARVKEIKAGLSRDGSHQVEAQLEQNPQRQDGALFRMTEIPEEVFADFPKQFDEVHRFWDLAGSEDGDCETAGALVGRRGEDFYLLDMDAAKMEGDEVESRVAAVAALDWSAYMRDGEDTLRSSFEREPGASGKRDAQVKERKWQQWQIHQVPPDSSKRVRAGQLATIIANGRYHMPMDALWYKETYAQMEVFTGENSGMKDRVDAQTGAVLEMLHPTHRNKQLVVAEKSKPGEADSYKPYGKCECCKRPAFSDGGHCCAECRASGGQRHSPACHSSFNDWYVRHARD